MEETLILANRLFQCKLNCFRDGIILSQQIDEIISRHSSRPFHVNVIEAACRGRFKETGHSLVLAALLEHHIIQSSFIEKFLNIQHESIRDVIPEKDRVDVALKGEDIFIIVENKVNAAKEQKNQMYRYVHEIGIKKYGFKLSQIYVVYLNPSNRTPPSAYSLCDNNNENNVFEALGKDHYTVLSYKYDITDWLRELSFENEPHISSALDQYVDFLENKFHTSQIDKDMNNEIKDFILKGLHVEDESFHKQIEALDKQIDKVNELLNSIDNIKVELSHEIMRKWQSQCEEELKNQCEKELEISLYKDEHSFGVQLTNGVWLGVWDGYDSREKLPYWGFQLDNYKESEMPEISKCIKGLLESVGVYKYKTENDFIAWCTIEEDSDMKFLLLYRGAKEKELLK